MKFLFLAFIASLAIAVFLSPFASSHPDGLEKVAEDQGFHEKATEVWTKSPLPDYALPFEINEAISTGAAGAAGTVAVFALLYFGGRALAAGRQNAEG